MSEQKKTDKQNESPFRAMTVLNAWKNKNHNVQIWFATGAKFEGVIRDIEKYEITVEDPNNHQIYVFFKANIACITKVKEVSK